MNTRSTAVLSLLAVAATAGFAQANVDVAITPGVMQTESSQATWTEADYANARVLSPKVNSLPASVTDFNAAAAESQRALQGSAKGGRGGADASHLREMRRAFPRVAEMDADNGVAPEAVGTGGIYFTSSRASVTATDTTYPNRTVGKLYFKIGALSYMCSGSMIKPGIVVTAGHCVHSGNGASTGWYNSFQFIPAYRNAGGVDSRPYGTWTSWARVSTSSDWYSGGGGVPNLRDWAVITFNADRAGLKIGNYTGWLGYQYPRMIGRQQAVLGYPGNLDTGGILHRIDSIITNYGSNNGTWGSDMQGGSSGGPVVQNFQQTYVDSSTLPSENESNRVTSVVSWGYISSLPKVQGGSQFDSVFGTMVSNACTAHPWAC